MANVIPFSARKNFTRDEVFMYIKARLSHEPDLEFYCSPAGVQAAFIAASPHNWSSKQLDSFIDMYFQAEKIHEEYPC